MVRPLHDTTIDSGPLAQAAFTFEMARGWRSLEDEQAWQLRLHGLVELWRFNEDLTVAFTAHHELTASPYSSIGFNPRTARWEEQILVQGQVENILWTAGVLHRCKHDIDNNEPPNDDTSNVQYIPTRRAVILSGIKANVQHSLPFATAGAFTLSTSLGADYYPISEDYRTPGGNDEGSWKDMEGAVNARLDLSVALSDLWSVTMATWASVPWFTARNMDDNGIPFDGRAELRLTARRNVSIDAFIAVDHQFDEVVYLSPQPTTVVQVGLRLGGFQ